MKIIIGLGNPGLKYEKTRHNFGFQLIDYLVQELKAEKWKTEMRFNASLNKAVLGKEKIILAKPQTFMNDSGLAVKTIINYYKIKPEEILVLHDDLDLFLGEIRVQKGRGSAGHRGVQSIIDQLAGQDFIRLRLGIRPLDNRQSLIETEKFVLQNFAADEEKTVQQTIKKAAQIIMTAPF